MQPVRIGHRIGHGPGLSSKPASALQLLRLEMLWRYLSDHGAVKLPLGTWNSNDTTAHSNPDHIPLHCIATLQLMSESHRLPSSHRHKCSTSEALELSRKC